MTGAKFCFVRGCSFVLSYLGILFLLANRQLNITKWPQNLFVYPEIFICAQIRPSTWRIYLRADKFIWAQINLFLCRRGTLLSQRGTLWQRRWRRRLGESTALAAARWWQRQRGGGWGIDLRGHQYPFSVCHIMYAHSRSKSWAHSAGGRRRHSCMPAHALRWTFLGYSTVMIFLMPLSKRSTGARTIGEIFSSIEVHDVNIPDILMVVLCETLPAKDTICSIYGSIEFLLKNNIST